MSSTPAPGAVQSSTPYRRPTFSPATSAWHAFHRRWWGSAGANLLDAAKESESRVLHVDAEPEVTAKLGIQPTSGAIYLRPELLHTYARAKRASTRFPSTGSGVAFLGQQGTGKSYLLVYLLLERMAAAQMTLFFTYYDNLVYLVDADGVRCLDAKFLHTDCIPASAYGSTWILVDSSYDHSPRFPIFLSPIFFTVHLSSFLLSEHRWTSKKDAVTCILDPWNVIEIFERCV
ncbi:hypothetical protein EXIGLDRAFT_360914 [Exidia glandulosa HHB12029]|uniref:Uncharacterized protein n=1 Tax=Exidia glandulosa HHB12029 TaxID=1314781 RepID=A0A165C6D2_EXIGL|nr:hypothetical protein EXIGLDRAFT_360914 [Exidia glandulosa HHB12029]